MAQFAGRENELGKLESAYSGKGPRICCIYGQPRVGTSFLAKEFCTGRRSVTVCFPEGTEREILSAMHLATEKILPEIPAPGDYGEAFGLIGDACGDRKTVVLLDNVGYAYSETFGKALSAFAEKYIIDTENLLILCGSPAEAVMKLSEIPLIKDNTAETIVLEPLTFRESRKLSGKMPESDAYMCYLTAGGIPLYHALMNKPDYGTCIEKCFLGTYPRLCAEAELIMRRSSVPYRYCAAILGDIAGGCGRPIDIANGQKISRQLCEIYLKKMESEGLIERVTPIANAPRKPVFIVRNALLEFYHTAIRNNPALAFGKKEFRDIEPLADMFLEFRFRIACREYLKKDPRCVKTGGWWLPGESTDSMNLAAEMKDGDSEYILLCDCKFRKEAIDSGALGNLKNRAEAMGTEDVRLAMFSISGFDGGTVKAAGKENVLLIGPKEILGRISFEKCKSFFDGMSDGDPPGIPERLSPIYRRSV